MAAPLKQGIDYFPLDCVLEDSFQLLEATFGTDGIKAFGVIIKMYQKAYKQKGYFYEWTEDNQLLFSREINVSINEVSAYINEAVKRGIFDKEKFDMGIITSRGMQKRFIEATKRRMELTIYENIWLVNVDSIPKNVNNNPRNVSILLYNNSHIILNTNTYQRESKEQPAQNAPAASSPPPSGKNEPKKKENTGGMGKFENVALSSEEYTSLLTEYGMDKTDEYIDRLSIGIEKKGYEYKSHYAAILDWILKDKAKEKDKRQEVDYQNYTLKRLNGGGNVDDGTMSDEAAKAIADGIKKRRAVAVQTVGV